MHRFAGGPENLAPPHPGLALFSVGPEEHLLDGLLGCRFVFLEDRVCVLVPILSSRCLSRKQKVGGEILGNWLWDFVADTALLAGLGAPWVVETPGGTCRFLARRGSAA